MPKKSLNVSHAVKDNGPKETSKRVNMNNISTIAQSKEDPSFMQNSMEPASITTAVEPKIELKAVSPSNEQQQIEEMIQPKVQINEFNAFQASLKAMEDSDDY